MAIKKQTFMKGVAIIMVSQILVKVFGFIYRIVLTNIEGFSDIGNSYYGAGYKVYAFILAIATMGIPNTISKLVSEKLAVGDNKGAHKIFKTAIAVFATVGLCFSLTLFLSAEYIANNLLSNPGVKYTLMVLSPAVLFVSIASVYRGYFVGMQNMVAHSVAQIIEQIVNSILSIMFVMILVSKSPEIMAAGSTAATAVSTLVALLYLLLYYQRSREEIKEGVNNSERKSREGRKQIVKKIIQYVIPISFGSIVITLAGMIDLVTVMEGLQKYGYTLKEANEKFGILLGKVDILTSVPLALNVAFSTSLVPVITSAITQGKKAEAVSKINYSMKISSLIAFPCAIGLSVLATPIIQMLFPNASEGAYLLRIEAFVVVFSVLAQTAYGSLHGLGKLYIPGFSLLIGAVVKYFLNVIFVPIFGEIVVPITTIIYQLIAVIISMVCVYSTLNTKFDNKNIIIKPFIASTIMGIVTILSYFFLHYITKSNSISVLVSIAIATLTYIMVLANINAMAKEEIMQLPYGNKVYKIIKKMKKV
ncbi:MAG: polysaccharide biosynthesis protein [Clostridia bacterium]|nr:polysaccharide biosynthesis protein [Clostridia bacterium]